MASTVSKPKALRFAVIHGLTGGPIHSRKLNRLLRQAGFKPTKQADSADIIIAHSAGCWLIPTSAKPKLVLYVGMPLAQTNPRRTWLAANAAMFKSRDIIQALKVRLKNTYYSVRQPRRNLRIIRMAKIAQPVILPNAKGVFIANQHDPWPKSDKLQNHLDEYDWAFLSMKGFHDDIWQHPEYYVAIINHYAKLLA
jgi:hypothetical protein